MLDPMTIGAAVAFTGAIAVANERWNLLSGDRFAHVGLRIAAYLWLGAFTVGIAVLVKDSSSRTVTPADLAGTPFWSIFVMHAILLAFLTGWWLLTGRPEIRSFFNIHGNVARGIAIGIAVGFGGWFVTIGIALLAGLSLSALEVMPGDLKPSPMIPWLAALPFWQKGLVVLSAMSVEELFFRGWLQKRTGLVVSTILFALAHAGYGQPFMLIGITAISVVIGVTFWMTRNLIPCIVAHGVFDAIQIFVIVPLALKFLPGSA